MAQTIHEIEEHIEWTREKLGEDFRGLEEKVSAATDLRAHYERTPGVFLGVAVVGGAMLAAMLSGKRTKRAVVEAPNELRTLTGDRQPNQTRQVVNNVTSALIGVGAAKFTEYVESMLPGFGEHYRRAAHTE